MCGPNPDVPWECEKCFGKMQENLKARLCWECYEFGKANADNIIRDTWVWGEDLEPYADEIKSKFLKELEEQKPLSPRCSSKSTESEKNAKKIANCQIHG
jgi:hypothetical protein